VESHTIWIWFRNKSRRYREN